jgi:hypothetical protein
MESAIIAKRGLFVFLVIASVIIFIGMAWILATSLPWNQPGATSPNPTLGGGWMAANCTYPIGFWVEHPELYPQQMVIGSKVYQAAEIRQALLAAGEEPFGNLQAQLVGAFLNISAGADQSLIDATIYQAYEWIVQHPAGSQFSNAEVETGTRLTSVLEAYNLGLAGVAACQEASNFIPASTFTATSTTTQLPTGTATSTPTPTPTLTQTATASPTVQPVFPTRVVASPTRTPTTQAPGEPPATEMPAQTDTPNPPTAEPTATVEPPTAEPTLPPPEPTLP